MSDLLDFQFHDGGRADAGFKGTADDCVVRAIAIVGALDYQDVYDELYDLTRRWADKGRSRAARRAAADPRRLSPRTRVNDDVWKPFVSDELGWEWTPTMFVGQGTTVHLRRGELPNTDVPILVRCSKHVTTVWDDTILDTYDPSRDGTRCVYGYWTP